MDKLDKLLLSHKIYPDLKGYIFIKDILHNINKPIAFLNI